MTFSLWIGLGSTLGLAWIAWRSPEAISLRCVDASLWALLGGALGGRLIHTAFAWPYYQSHLLEIPQVWLGGLSAPGFAAGMLIALGVYAAVSGLSFSRLVDALLPLGFTLTVSAWLACWSVGSAYGVPTAAWWGVPARDEWGQVSLRWPVQLVGALLSVLIFWLLEKDTLIALVGRFTHLPKPRSALGQRLWRVALRAYSPLRRLAARRENAPPGVHAGWLLFFLFLEFLGLSFLRADPVLIWRGLRLDSWAWGGFAALSVLWLLYLSFLGD